MCFETWLSFFLWNTNTFFSSMQWKLKLTKYLMANNIPQNILYYFLQTKICRSTIMSVSKLWGSVHLVSLNYTTNQSIINWSPTEWTLTTVSLYIHNTNSVSIAEGLSVLLTRYFMWQYTLKACFHFKYAVLWFLSTLYIIAVVILTRCDVQLCTLQTLLSVTVTARTQTRYRKFSSLFHKV